LKYVLNNLCLTICVGILGQLK